MSQNDDDVHGLLDAVRELRRDKRWRDPQFRSDLERAERSVGQGRIRVERQRDIVRLLRKRGTDAAAAEDLLAQLEEMLAVQIQHLKDLTGWKRAS